VCGGPREVQENMKRPMDSKGATVWERGKGVSAVRPV
jgi:hypothetical protein